MFLETIATVAFILAGLSLIVGIVSLAISTIVSKDRPKLMFRYIALALIIGSVLFVLVGLSMLRK